MKTKTNLASNRRDRVKLDAVIESLGLTLHTYNQCRLIGLNTVADVLDAFYTGRLNKKTKTGRELLRFLKASGFAVVQSPEEVEIDALKNQIDLLVARRDKELDAVRERYQPDLETLRENLAAMQADRRERLRHSADEPADAPVRYCATCGDEMLRATVENAKMAYEIADQLLADAGKRFSSTTTISVSTVRRMKLQTNCCHSCQHEGKGQHSVLCFSKPEMEESKEDLEEECDD